MAQLADILIGSTLPLHPLFGKSPRLSLQLIQGERILKETRPAIGDKNGIWDIDSPLNLPDTNQPLTLAVISNTKGSKRRLVSAIIRVPDLCARLKAAPNEHYEFTTCDSCASLQVVVSCSIKRTTTNIPGTFFAPVAHTTRYLADDVINGNEQNSMPEEPRKFLQSTYAKFAYLPNSDKKLHILSTIGGAYHELYRQSQDADDLDKAISIQREAVDLGHFHARQAQHLKSLSSALEDRYDYNGNPADIEAAIQASQNALVLTQRDAPERADLLMQLASNHNSRAKRLGDVADIDMAVSTYSEAVVLIPNKAMGHNNLAGALLQRFLRFGVLEDLNRAILNLENAVNLTPDGHSSKPSRYSNLGGALQFRFERLGNLADLESAISNQENALNLAPEGHPDKASIHSNLGGGLRCRFERLGNLTDLEMAITNSEYAAKLTPNGHPEKAARYNNLGNILQCRFERLGALADLEMAVINHENAVKLTPDSHPNKAALCSNLGLTLQVRYGRCGTLADLEMAIINLENAVRLMPDGHSSKPSLYNNLGNVFRSRFRCLDVLADLEMAITNMEKALRLTPGEHPDKPSRYSNLGLTLQFRFERLGTLADLEMAITNQENAVKLTPDGHPDKPSRYEKLGSALQHRFERLGNLADLERAITNKENAIRLTPDEHPDKALRYNNLGSTLRCRFERLDVISDLEMAITSMENAVRLTPDGHPGKSLVYGNLGVTLQCRFEHLDDLADLERAITYMENAVKLSADGHPDNPSRFSNLGNAFRCRFERLGVLSDLEMSITNFENAVTLTPDGHPDKAAFYSNLGVALQRRFESLGDLSDLRKAITISENAVRLIPDGHTDKAFTTLNLAFSYETYFKSSAKSSDLELAHSLYATVAQSPVSRPLQRFKASFRWAHCAKLMNSSPLPAYRCAIDQLPRIAWLGIPVSEQHSLLKGIGRGVREAVAAAIGEEEYEMAVEWLEQGRSIVWQNLLKLRTPLEDLRALHPKLAAQLQSISQHLDAPSSRDLERHIQQPTQPREVAKSHASLAIEWDETIDQIRKLPSFETFLKPKGFDYLVPATHEGPVVILNVSDDRCDALVLIPDDNGGASVVSIPLENFTFEKSRKLLQEMKNLLRMAGVREGDTRAQNRKSQKSDPTVRFKSALRMLWMEVVKPVLVGLAYQPQISDLPRIWWCATGPLAFLPIHAAGDYDVTEVGHKLSDYAVSSYTPTITAILNSSYPSPSEDFKLLTVAEPSAPNCSTIPKTVEEVERIAKIASGVSVVSLAEEDATVERVRKGMRESNWVHLACHGQQDATKPLESRLILHDGTLKLSAIVQETLPNAEFAFLSACQTAMGDEKAEEESVHLAAGMLLAGYRGVVATMWSIRDDDGPRVAEVVYGRMLKDGKPNRKEAAYALHDAVKQLRDSGADFTSWVPFIHVGR